MSGHIEDIGGIILERKPLINMHWKKEWMGHVSGVKKPTYSVKRGNPGFNCAKHDIWFWGFLRIDFIDLASERGVVFMQGQLMVMIMR